MQRAGVVVGGSTQVVQFEDNDFAAGNRDVPVGRKAADAIVDGSGRRRVVNVNELIGCEVGVKSDSQQTTLAGRIDRDRHKWRREQRPGFDDS